MRRLLLVRGSGAFDPLQCGAMTHHLLLDVRLSPRRKPAVDTVTHSRNIRRRFTLCARACFRMNGHVGKAHGDALGCDDRFYAAIRYEASDVRLRIWNRAMCVSFCICYGRSLRVGCYE